MTKDSYENDGECSTQDIKDDLACHFAGDETAADYEANFGHAPRFSSKCDGMFLTIGNKRFKITVKEVK